MKTEIKTRTVDPEYPCFKMHKSIGNIVLFDKPGSGVQVHQGASGADNGRYYTSWYEPEYELWYGTIKVIP